MQLDTYMTVLPVNFISRSYANLLGTDLFFYVSDTNELRVKALSSKNVHLLQVGVKWVSTIPASDRVHVYYTDGYGDVNYLLFQSQNLVSPAKQNPIAIRATQTFSTCMSSQSTPPLYLLAADTGTAHTLYAASDPDFTTIIGSAQIFNNSIAQGFYASHPVIAVHPDDSTRVTVVCQCTYTDGSTKVGFYAAKIPGVGE